MKTQFYLASGIVFFSHCAMAVPAKDYFSQYAGYNDDWKKFLDGLDIKTGLIKLESGVELKLPEDFYFLDKNDATEVLVDAWGNPPESSFDTLGMIFPRKYDPISDGNWGIELTFDKMGFVKDEDAAATDYDELLSSMKSEAQANNADRTAAGYEPITLIGWASKPTYDQTNKRLHWAKEVQFGTDPSHTLNYNVRFLGREGVLMMNYIAKMEQLPEIKANLDPVLSLVTFSEGKRYSDFNPDFDTVAAVGIGGLIAGKLAAKAGLLAVGLVMLKKFGILLFAPVLWLISKFRGKNADS